MARLQIARFRRAAGLTQADLARRIGVTRQHLSAIENGHAELLEYMQQRIVRALELDPDDVNLMLGAPPFRGRPTHTNLPSDIKSTSARIRP